MKRWLALTRLSLIAAIAFSPLQQAIG